MSHVVEPDIERLKLPDGYFVDVKKELNAGEYVALLMDQGKGVYFAKVLHYVVSWSLVGRDDKPLPYSLDMPTKDRLDTLGALNVATMKALIEAVDAHESAQEQERMQKKTTPTTSRVLNQTSEYVAQ
jgi:hypothetical protein